MIDENSEKQNVYYIEELEDYILPPLICRGLETIHEEDEELIYGSSDKCHTCSDDSTGN